MDTTEWLNNNNKRKACYQDQDHQEDNKMILVKFLKAASTQKMIAGIIIPHHFNVSVPHFCIMINDIYTLCWIFWTFAEVRKSKFSSKLSFVMEPNLGLLSQASQATDTRLLWRKIQSLLQSTRQGEQAAQKTQLPDGFQARVLKTVKRRVSWGVWPACAQFSDGEVTGWYFWNLEIINLLVLPDLGFMCWWSPCS